MKTSHALRSCILAACLSFCPLAFGQSHSIYGSIVGAVTDQSGGVTPGVHVTATNVDTNISSTAETDGKGFYRIERLIQGAYRVRVEHANFKTFVREGITLVESETVRVDASLEVGAVTQTVSVTAQTPLLESESPQISSVIDWSDRKFMATRNTDFFSTLGLFPGAVTSSSGSTVSFVGSRDTQYDYSVDGQTFRSPYSGHNAFVGSFNEWQSEQSAKYVNNGAEYSQQATVNAATKSGSNDWHGSGVWYYTTGGLQGRSPFSPTPPSGVNQKYATSLGGPIRKNKAFFFASYSGSRNYSSANVVATVPTALMHQGIFTDVSTVIKDPSNNVPYPNQAIPASQISLVSAKFMQTFFPLPNFGGPGLSASNYRAPVPQGVAADDLFGRVDYRFSDRHTLFVRYMYDEGNRGNLFSGSLPTVGYRQGFRRDQNATISDLFVIRPNLYNEFSIGFTRDHNAIFGSTNYGPDQSGLIEPSFPFPAMPQMTIAGFTAPTEQDYQDIPEDIVNIKDNISWINGRHRFKAGVIGAKNYAAQVPISGSRVLGLFTFTNSITGYALANFMLGIPNTLYRINPSYFFKYVYRERDTMGAFVQDDIQVSRSLTVNLGLRYEYGQPWKEAAGRQDTFDPTTGKLVVPGPGSVSLVNPAIMHDYGDLIETAAQAGYSTRMITFSELNFAPRVGLAWRPMENTVVRAGYGIFYDMNPPSTQATLDLYSAPQNFPTNQIVNGQPVFKFPNPFQEATPIPGYGLLSLNVGPKTIRVPYTQQWNLTLEHMFFGNTGVRLSYIGSKGVEALGDYNLNSSPLSLVSVSQAQLPYPRYGSISYDVNGVGHSYNAMQIEVNHRGRKGITFNSHFTWAKDLGYSDTNGLYGNSITDPFDRRYDYGNTAYIPLHRWVTTFNWELPIGRGKPLLGNMPRALDLVVGGWRSTGIVTVSSGHWLTPTYCGYNPIAGIYSAGYCGRPDRVKDGNLPKDQRTWNQWFDLSAFTFPGANPATPLTGPSGPIGRLGNAGRDIVSGPGFWQVDSGLVKNFPIWHERLRMNLAALATNLFNHPNPSDPAMDISVPLTAGKITSILGDNNTSGIGMRQITLNVRLEF